MITKGFNNANHFEMNYYNFKVTTVRLDTKEVITKCQQSN